MTISRSFKIEQPNSIAQPNKGIFGCFNSSELLHKYHQSPADDTHRFSFNNRAICFISNRTAPWGKYEDRDVTILCFGSTVLNQLSQISKLYQAGKINKIRQSITTFSVLIFDKAKNKLILISAHLGTHPWYYCETHQGLFFANTQKQLLQSAGLEGNLNHDVLFELFHLGFISPPDTLIKQVKCIPPSHYLDASNTIELKPFRYSIPEKASFSPSKMNDLLCDSIDESTGCSREVHILCSGGLDSSILAAIAAKKLNKRPTLHVIAFDKDSPEYTQTQFLKDHLECNVIYFSPTIENVFAKVQDSLEQGESEMVGILSLNASLEFLFSQHVLGFTDSLLTGDDNLITPPNVTQQSPGYYHLKYGLLETPQILQLLTNGKKGMLRFVNKFNSAFDPVDVYSTYRARRVDIHSTLIGKIIAKYRFGLSEQQTCVMPLNHPEYTSYIDRLNYHDPNFNYRSALQNLAVSGGLLPASYFQQQKAWMPSVWKKNGSDLYISKIMKSVISEKDELGKFINFDRLCDHFQMNYCNNSKVILLIYYLQYFYNKLKQ